MSDYMNTYGWNVNDVVTFTREWCPVCAKSRVHEVYQGVFYICSMCGEQKHVAISPTSVGTENRYEQFTGN